MWRQDLHTDTRIGLWQPPGPRPDVSRHHGTVPLTTPRNIAPLGMDPMDTRTWTRPMTDTTGMLAFMHERPPDTSKARKR